MLNTWLDQLHNKLLLAYTSCVTLEYHGSPMGTAHPGIPTLKCCVVTSHCYEGTNHKSVECTLMNCTLIIIMYRNHGNSPRTT